MRLSPHSARHDKGFTLLLVLIVLFLVMLLCLTYLRVMRMSSVPNVGVSGNISPVLTHLQNDIRTLIGQDGDLNAYEPHDYPWTCSRANATCQLGYPYNLKSAVGIGDPRMDDRWLAPIEPENGRWPQVSCLYGSFINHGDKYLGNIPVNLSTLARVPSDAPAGRAIDGLANNQFVKFQDLDTTPGSDDEKRMVDADGDGVADSLWFYPPDSLQGDVRYIAAVRIIDASGLLNINTALGELGSTPGSQTGTPRKGEGPYEINSASLGLSIPSASLTFRQAGVAAGPSGRIPSDWTNWDYWWASGGRTTDTGDSFVANRYGNEAKLRDHFNDYADDGKPESQIWRDYPALGNNAGNRKYVTTVGGVRDLCAPLPYAPYRDPGSAGFARARRPYDLYIEQENVNSLAPSAGYPTPSGTTRPDFTYQGARDQQWFNEAWNGTSGGVPDFFRGIDHTRTITNTDADTSYPYPAGFRHLTASTNADTRAGQYQIQMGASSLHDVLGRDNNMTVASQWNGWEPLPMMTEFYAQMPYVTQATYVKIPLGAATPVLVFPGVKLSDLSIKDIQNLNGCISWDATPRYRSDVYFYNQTATQITFRYQAYANDANGNWTRSANVTMTETPAGVVAVSPVAGKYIAGDHRNEDPTGWPGTDNNYAGFFGLPRASGSTWSQIYTNLTATRAGLGGAGNSAGELVFGGNNLTNTDWRAPCSAGMGSYAFELVNPYAIPIRLANLRFVFRRQDYALFDAANDGWAGDPQGPSMDLSAYVNAAPPAGMAKDAEGYYVLKPGEKAIFYRNGTENFGPSGAARIRLHGGPVLVAGAGTQDVDLMATLFPSGLPANTYAINLGTGTGDGLVGGLRAPDINSHPSTWNVDQFELQAQGQASSGGSYISNATYNWLPYQRVAYERLYSGWNSGNAYSADSEIPDGQQGAPGGIVYKQVSLKTFGVSEKLNLLQSRPPLYTQNNATPITDWGDWVFQTNTYANPIQGVLTLPLPVNGTATNTWGPGQAHTASTQPIAASWMFFRAAPGWISAKSYNFGDTVLDPTDSMIYICTAAVASTQPPNLDSTHWRNSGTTPLPTLGTDTKVAFPGPNGSHAMYAGSRQSIKNETMLWSYVGIPGDGAYPGTFPELTGTASDPSGATMAIRNNSASGLDVERKDGIPRTLDLLRVPFVGPLYTLCANSGAAKVGNTAYRGTNALSTNWYSNTMGDALNFYLTKDVEVNGAANASGLRGLSLRTDVPWFDWVNAATKYPGLTALPTVVNQEYLSGSDIFISQGSGPWAAPDPTPGSGNVGVGKSWAYSNGPYARASQFWQLSWGEIFCGRLQVDSPKYKGKTGANGDNWKPGMINLNTAPKSVLQCLSLPTGANSAAVADKIIAMRKAPLAGASVAGGTRQGLVLASEAFGADGLKSYSSDATLTGGKFYTSDPAFNLETLSWLPQQASCRSDAFIAYIVVQGYHKGNFNLGPVEVARQILVMTRDGTGAAATLVGGVYSIPLK